MSDDDFEFTHIVDSAGRCWVSMNGQGYWPCSEHNTTEENMDTGDTFPAIATLRLSSGEPRYVGTVQSVFTGETWRCVHKHATRSQAMRCAEKHYETS